MSRRRIATLSLVALSVLWSGCSQNNGESDPSPQSEESPGSPKAGGTITVGATAEPDTLDPYVGVGGDASNIIIHLYDTLVEIDATQNFELVPGLAESWETSDDGLTWTFTLREGVTFHDGQTFTAADVQWSLEQAMKPAASGTATQLSGIDSVNVPDDSTVVLELLEPNRELLTTLTYVFITQEEKTDYNNDPVGTGPFKFASWERNREIVLEANDDYWKDGLPYLDEVVYKTIPDASVRTQQLLSGELDMVTVVPYNQIEQVTNAGILLPEFPESVPVRQGMYDVRINTRGGPLSDELVRQAISYAVDRSAISDAMHGLMPTFANPVPESNPYFNPDAIVYEHDAEKAEQLLAEAGYSDGVDIGTIDVHAESGPEFEIIAQLMQSHLAEVGIEMDINTTTVADWVEKVLVQADFDLGLSRNIPLPSAYELIAHTYAKQKKHAYGWDHSEFYELLAAARTMNDEQEYEHALKQLQQWAMEGMPSVILGGVVNPPGLQPYVEGFRPDPELLTDLTTVWLNK